MRPILKYRGGKSKEIPEFIRYIPNEYNRYIEPFLGGGAVYFYLEPEQAIINDINTKLIEFYQDARNDFPRLQVELGTLQQEYEHNQRQYVLNRNAEPDQSIRVENLNEGLYYQMRDMFNGTVASPYLNGTLYYFINKTAYSGMIRYNRNGEYNVPFGRYVNFNTGILTQEHNQLLQGAQILNTDYANVFNMAADDDFMFLDPPYDCAFNDYGNLNMQEGFNEDEHRRLAQDFRNLNCRTLMIIGRTPLTEELYGNYIRDEYRKNYSVNIRNRFNAEAMHIVVTNY